MKRLKTKVFWVIFSLLTAFTLVVFISSITTNYISEKNSISKALSSFSRTPNRRDDDARISSVQLPPTQEPRKIYLDFTIYTIILDESGNYKALVNNTSSDELDEDNVKQIATTIISSHKENFYIGNLYSTKYSYAFTNNNTLIIMDNTTMNKSLLSQLGTSVLIFVLCEIIIFIITYLITKWITDPVNESFEKQKIFVADASHELKTPLSVMIASADAYFNDKDDKWVNNMKNESERMIKLVTELLDLAKTEREQDLVMSVNNLSNIIESSVLTFESLFYDKNIKLKYDIEPNINLSCNEDSITELMSILIDNSIKHCSEKGKVFVNLSKKNKQIVLEVKNTGLPIKKEDEEKIFERFYKVDSSRNRNTNNYGLGLAIAKNIVKKHNGEIKAHSENGYTTFKVTWNQK